MEHPVCHGSLGPAIGVCRDAAFAGSTANSSRMERLVAANTATKFIIPLATRIARAHRLLASVPRGDYPLHRPSAALPRTADERGAWAHLAAGGFLLFGLVRRGSFYP